MRFLLLLAALAAALLAAFVLLNWSFVVAIVPLDVGVATVQGETGLLMLGLAVAVIALLAICLAAQVTVSTRARRAQAKALDAQRALAEQAEASRLSELRAAMTAGFERLASSLSASQDALRVEIRDNSNAMAAMLAEIDDRAVFRERPTPLER